jgi:fructose/tagatose bisphosphate aldolase
MPIATPEVYAEMLDRAKANEFAYPAINVTSSETLNAALRGFADAESDGIIQFSTGGAEFASGTKVKNMVTGATALAEFAHVVAEKYPVNIALHTDHCPKDKLDGYVRPLLAISQERHRWTARLIFGEVLACPRNRVQILSCEDSDYLLRHDRVFEGQRERRSGVSCGTSAD